MSSAATTPSDTCGVLVCWDNGWWPCHHPCSKPPHDGGTHIAAFRSFGGVPMYAILPPGQRYAHVYVDTRAKAKSEGESTCWPVAP